MSEVDHAAVGRRSKGKGAGAELEVGRILTPWWRRLEPEARFVRTPGSGGWRHAKGFRARGDLVHDPECVKLWPFSLEVKRREGWSELNFQTGGRSPVWQWWLQTQRAALDDCRRPMLWFRKNQPSHVLRALALPITWLVMIDSDIYDRVRVRGMTPPLIRFEAPRSTVVLTHLQLVWIPPRALVNAVTLAR